MNNQKGFTLIELMIVIAIIGILAVIAIPAYQNYVKKAAYSEILVAMAPIKTAVDVCYASTKNLGACATASDIGESLPTDGTKALDRIDMAEAGGGAFIAKPNEYKGIVEGDTCTLKPTAEDSTSRLIWEYSGPCADNGYVKN